MFCADQNGTTFKWSHSNAITYQKWQHSPPVNTPNKLDCSYVATSKAFYVYLYAIWMIATLTTSCLPWHTTNRLAINDPAVENKIYMNASIVWYYASVYHALFSFNVGQQRTPTTDPDSAKDPTFLYNWHICPVPARRILVYIWES